METPDQEPDSKITSVVAIIKRLLRFDPLFAILVLLTVAPLAPNVIGAVVNYDAQFLILFAGYILVLMLFVYLPLLIVKGFIDKEKNLSKERQEAMRKEMEQRIKNAEFNREQTLRIINAKLDLYNAQSQAILEITRNYDKHLIEKAKEDLREILKGEFSDLPFVDNKSCTERISMVVEAFKKVENNFESLQESVPQLSLTLERIEKGISEVKTATNIIASSDEPEVVEKQATALYQLLQDHEKLKIEMEALTEEHDQLLATNKQLAITNEEFQEELRRLKAPKKVDEDLKQKTQTLKIHETSQPIQPVQFGFKEESEFQEALSAIDSMTELPKDEPPQPLPEPEAYDDFGTDEKTNFWTCKYCGNDNPLKSPRCKRCAKGRG